MNPGNSRELFQQLRKLATEQRNPASRHIDLASVGQILRTINTEDRVVAKAVRREIPHIASAVRVVVEALRSGGRLIYVGAGTSGRLGVLDAAECPPTYGTSPQKVRAVIAGGRKAVFRSQEGAEDRLHEGIWAMKKLRISRRDVVCGIAASMRTPFVIGAMRQAKLGGAKTVFVTTNPRSRLSSREFTDLRKTIDVAICPDVGPEVVMGSTRMKSATAQKLVLNMITTAAMIRLGKVYENMMVDLRMSSRKLVERAKRVLMIAAEVDYATASNALRRASGHVKTAIVMLRAGVTEGEARRMLAKADGFVRRAMQHGGPR